MAAQVVEKALNELELNVRLLDLGKNILDFLLLFVFLLLIVTLFKIKIYYALIPSVLFFAIKLGLSFYKNYFLDVENKIPELNEKLRTVSDNVNKSNEIIDSLKEDVVKDIPKVKTDFFIDYRWSAIKILLVSILAIIVVISAFLNVNFDLSLSGVPLLSKNIRDTNGNLTNLDLKYLEGNLSSILGNRSVAILGTKELNLALNPLESDADVNNIKKVSKEDFNTPDFPKEIYTSYDVAYNERISKGNQKVIKNYFEKISR